MGIYNLETLFDPRTIGLVGRFDCHSCQDRAIYRNLLASAGRRVVMINLAGCRSDGDCPFRERGPCVTSLAEVEGRVDLLVVTLPLAEIPALLAACPALGVKNMIVTRGGVAADGKADERLVLAAARENGVRLLGCNSFGLVVPGRRLNVSFFEPTPAPGKIALISQSGAIISSILDLGRRQGIGFSHVVSLGSLLDVDFGDAIDYLGWEYNVRCILLYIENLKDVKKFLSACRSVARIKPIVAIKSGKGELARQVISKHTGHFAGDDRVYDTALRRAGVIRVETITDLLTAGSSLTSREMPAGERLGVVTNSGGVGVLLVDNLASLGLAAAPLPPALKEALLADIKPYSGALNPVCISSEADNDRFLATLRLCLERGGFATLMVAMVGNGRFDPAAVINGVRALAAERGVRMIYIWLGIGEEGAARAPALEDRHNMIFFSVEEAVRVYYYGMRYYEKVHKIVIVPPRFNRTLEFDRRRAAAALLPLAGSRPRLLSESAAREILAAYRLPVNPVQVVYDFAAAAEAAARLGYPVVLKDNDHRRYHRSDVHGVYLGLHDRRALRRAWDALAAAGGPGVHGFTIQRQLEPLQYELHLGVRTDREFGPYLYLGLGGPQARLRRDEAVILPPLNRLLAEKLIDKTRLEECRRFFPFDRERLAEILVRLSQLVVDFPQVYELSLDPLAVSNGRFAVLDAKLILWDRGRRSPEHLATTPYPNQYEFRERLRDGTEVLIRPIRPEDVESHYEFVASLSRQTTYNRFFSYEKELPVEQMARFTQIDYDREIAIVARVEEDGRERTIGVNRLVYYPHNDEYEFAIVVADDWQGSGIGGLLMEKLIAIARDRGIRRIYGLVLAENQKMLRFSRRFGFRVAEREEDALRIVLELDNDGKGGETAAAGGSPAAD
ncbi:MAG: bifunctional acetate--CoA ligase family protein/GNAT family N-acetyltransferase [Deltaproteobacteria bacterium]|nr:bifunctional acetate--CoA ligase family protein/GNAT family N-acetyltransferase [Deltaproteobacteria bacterium]